MTDHIKASSLKPGDSIPYPGAESWGVVTDVSKGQYERRTSGGYLKYEPCINVELDGKPVWSFHLGHTTIVRRKKNERI